MRQEISVSAIFKRSTVFPRVYSFHGIPWNWVSLGELTDLYNEVAECRGARHFTRFTRKDVLWKCKHLFRRIRDEEHSALNPIATIPVFNSLEKVYRAAEPTKPPVIFLVTSGPSRRPFCVVSQSLLGDVQWSENEPIYVPEGWARDVLKHAKET